ncbi:MAG: hypothetical protein RB191_13380 [Terriglobia bacterium]|nr:hypothetical protein [Terriglobia bacterium]
MHTQDIPAVSSVLNALEAEAAKSGPLADVFADWASLLRGEPSPWALPWDMDAAVFEALSAGQLDGASCIWCDRSDGPMMPVRNGPRGQLFAHTTDCLAA